MEGIFALGKKYGFRIIEDASHAIGGRFINGDQIGSCSYSDITVFSFHPVKVITTGEGGMALTNDPKLGRQMQLLRSHGITRDTNEMTHATEGSWYYQQIDLGFNYRMTDMQAALGFSQLQRVDEFVSIRHTLAKQYDELLADFPVVTPWQQPGSYSGWHLYVIRLKLDKLVRSQRQVFETLHEANIGVNLHYIPVYRHPYYEQLGFNAGYCMEAEHYYAEAISLPIYPSLTQAQQIYVATVLRQALVI